MDLILSSALIVIFIVLFLRFLAYKIALSLLSIWIFIRYNSGEHFSFSQPLPPSLIEVYRKYKYIQKNKEYKSKKEHVAIILANKHPGKMGHILYILEEYGGDLFKLIKYFKNKKIPFKVYDNITEDIIKNIVKKEKTKYIIFMGHGCKHGFRMPNGKTLYYCELGEVPHKKLIAQLHCCHEGGRSLADYNKPAAQFVKDRKLNNIDVNKTIDDIIKFFDKS